MWSTFTCPLCNGKIGVGAHRCPMAKQTTKGVKEPVEVGAKVEVNNLTTERHLNGACGLCTGVMMGEQCHRIIVKFDPPRQHMEPMSFKEYNVFVRTAAMIPTTNRIEIGSFVIAKGLQMDAGLNDQKGEVIGKQFSKDGSVCTMVDFPPPWGKMLLRTENCQPVSQPRQQSDFTAGLSVQLAPLESGPVSDSSQNETNPSQTPAEEVEELSTTAPNGRSTPQVDPSVDVSNPTSVVSSTSEQQKDLNEENGHSDSLLAGLSIAESGFTPTKSDETRSGLSIVLPTDADNGELSPTPPTLPSNPATTIPATTVTTPSLEPSNVNLGRQPLGTGRRRTRRSTAASATRSLRKEIEQSETSTNNTHTGTPTSCSLSLDSSFRESRHRPGVINFPSNSLSNVSTPVSTPGSTPLDTSLSNPSTCEGKVKTKRRSRNSAKLSKLQSQFATQATDPAITKQPAAVDGQQKPKENTFSFSFTKGGQPASEPASLPNGAKESAFSFTSETKAPIKEVPFAFTKSKPVAPVIDLVKEGRRIKDEFHPAAEVLQAELLKRIAVAKQLIETTVSSKQLTQRNEQKVTEALTAVSEAVGKVGSHENKFLAELERWNRTRELQKVTTSNKFSNEFFDTRRKDIEAKKEILKGNIAEIKAELSNHQKTETTLQQAMAQRVENFEDQQRATSTELDDLTAEEGKLLSRIRDLKDKIVLKEGEYRSIEGELLLLASKKEGSQKNAKIAILTTIQKIDDLEFEMSKSNNEIRELIRVRETNVATVEEMRAKVTSLDNFQKEVTAEIEEVRSNFAERTRLKSIFKNKIPEIRVNDLERDLHNKKKKLQIANSRIESAKHQHERQQQELLYHHEDNKDLLEKDLTELESRKKEAAKQRNFKLASSLKTEMESAQKLRDQANEIQQKIDAAYDNICQQQTLYSDVEADLIRTEDAVKAAPIMRLVIQSILHKELLKNDPKMPSRTSLDELIFKGDTHNKQKEFLSKLRAEATALWEKAIEKRSSQ
eukprot:TRINITY_DN5695_c0_g1_i2.p1 TRINITY_DN5695_c0_g1~~TRINITY_DN5695_c0_g1_i2.p1  ORF type:complete len:1006 (+),score=274.08 TRINITY_DN5695_c0_g1_i2:135-3152(+)